MAPVHHVQIGRRARGRSRIRAGGGRREADPRQGPRPTRPLSEGCGSPRSQSSPLPLYAFSWRGHMLVSPRVLSRRARPWGCLGGRPEAASPPVYAKRALRQQVVIPASGSASATWSLAGPQRKPGRGAGCLRRNPDSVCAEGNPVPPSGK